MPVGTTVEDDVKLVEENTVEQENAVEQENTEKESEKLAERDVEDIEELADVNYIY